MRLRWLSPALAGLDWVYEYIAQENPKAARFVFTRTWNATQKLKRFPNAGRIGEVAGTRKLVGANLPFLVVYRVTGNDVQILRVLHTSQGFQRREEGNASGKCRRRQGTARRVH